MDTHNEREILEQLKHLSQIQPRSETLEADLRRVREALLTESRKGGSQMRKIIISTSVAAGLVLVVIAAFVLLSARPATAAEMFREVIETNGAYKGWIHMTLGDLQIGDPSVLPKEIPPLKSGSQHVNTTDGTIVNVIKFEDYFTVRFMSPPRGEYSEYDGKTNQLRIGTLADVTAKSLRESASKSPTTLEGLLAILKEQQLEKLEIIRTENGLYDRYEIRLTEPETKARNDNATLFKEAAIWVNRTTKLIEKAKMQMPKNVSFMVTFTYGEPVINDVYDVGVPRDAEVVNNRPKAAVQEVLDRLDKRYRQGFGDYVAIMTETPLREDGTLETDMCALHLFAQEAEAWLSCGYLVGMRQYRNGKPRQAIDLLPGWPFPDKDTVLAAIRSAAPSEFIVSDGERTWHDYHGEMKDKLKQMIPHERAQSSLPGKIWAGRSRMGLYGPDAKVELVADDQHPRLTGLRTETMIPVTPMTKQKEEDIRWIDSAHDDVIVEEIVKRYKLDGQTLEAEFCTQYLEQKQLLNGQWYPSHWKVTLTFWRDNRPKLSNIREYHLQIWPDIKLDRSWFTDRRKLDIPNEQ